MLTYPGFDHMGFRTRLGRGGPGFWPSPSGVVVASDPLHHNTGACPSREGDGVCVALTARGAASGGTSLATGVLLVGWRTADELGRSADKVRVARATVLAEIPLLDFLSGANLYGAELSGANLSGADLYGAELSGANLDGADLSRANLSGANLDGADLSRADLSGANLSGADLYGANLSRADLSGADLYGANLSMADLSRADLSRADLYGAHLSGADLYGANLSKADLSRANLSKADLSRARR